jgi:hypothetical protein
MPGVPTDRDHTKRLFALSLSRTPTVGEWGRVDGACVAFGAGVRETYD